MADRPTGKVFERMSRQFHDEPATPGRRPLLLGLVAPSGGGKTYSALRLATGITRLTGGDIFFIDTESNRALHYAEQFQFRHVPFTAPFGPLDYKAAIEHCMAKKPGCIIVDSMTHEHTGEGGILDQSEKQLDKWCGDDEGARKRNFQRSWIKPKSERRKLIDFIVHCGAETAFIFCFRAKESIDIGDKDKFGNPRQKGYQPETTSPLQYEMAGQFLLEPGSDGSPTLRSDRKEEAAMIKMPSQFRDWFKPGMQLTEEIGERFGRWMVGPAAEAKPKPENRADDFQKFVDEGAPGDPDSPLEQILHDMRRAKTTKELDALVEKARAEAKQTGVKKGSQQAKDIAATIEAQRARLDRPPAEPPAPNPKTTGGSASEGSPGAGEDTPPAQPTPGSTSSNDREDMYQQVSKALSKLAVSDPSKAEKFVNKYDIEWGQRECPEDVTVKYLKNAQQAIEA